MIASFPAREVVIGTMGVIYQLGADEDESSESLRESLQAATWDGTDRKVFSVPVALSLMVFFSLCAQCASTLVIIGLAKTTSSSSGGRIGIWSCTRQASTSASPSWRHASTKKAPDPMAGSHTLRSRI